MPVRSKFIKRNFWHPVLLGLIWAISIIIINPEGDFPLNDDWHFGYPVKKLLEGGHYELAAELPPNIFLQVAWGYLFCSLFGDFSFTLLRYSTLVLALTGLLLFFQFSKYITKKSELAFVLTLLLFFNPLFFVLSFSFMSDVPFLVLAIASLFAYYWGWKFQEERYVMLGFCFALTSFLIRQPGLLIPIAFEVFRTLRSGFHLRSLGYIMSAFFGYLLVEMGVKPALGVSENYIPATRLYFEEFWYKPLNFGFKLSKGITLSIFYLGFLTLPFFRFIFNALREKRVLSRWAILLLVLLNIGLTTGLFYHGHVFPYGGNYIYNFGLGPPYLSDVRDMGLSPGTQLPVFVIMIIGIGAQINGCLLFLLLWHWLIKGIRDPGARNFSWFLIILNGLYLPLMSVFSFFDRYLLLPYISTVLIFASQGVDRRNFRPAIIIGAAFALFSLAATKDYLEWNRAVEKSYRALLKKVEVPEAIDGGVALNGWYLHRTRNQGAEYAIFFNREVGNYAPVDSSEFFSWVSLRDQKIYIQKRE